MITALSPAVGRCMRHLQLVMMLATLPEIGAGCKPKPPTVVVKQPDGTPAPVVTASAAEEEKARALAQEASACEQRGDSGCAAAKRDTIVKEYPATLAAAELFADRAQAAAENHKVAEAIFQYEHLLHYRPDFPRADAAREAYAALLVEAGRYDDAEQNLKALYQNATGVEAQQRLGALLIDAQVGAGHSGAALGVLVELAALPGLPPAQRDNLRHKAEQVVSTSLSFNEAEEAWSHSSNQPKWAFLQPLLAFKLAKIYYHTRNYSRSEDMLRLIGERYAQSPYAASAADFLTHLQQRFVVDTTAVGVLLPLSGSKKLFGERLLSAIRMAVGKGTAIKLVPKDTGGDANVAAQAVETLVMEDHVVAIIGPIFSGEAWAAALKAEEFSVPLIALSHREGLPEIGPYVFRTGLPVSAQARALAHVAFDELGFSRFALLYPKAGYGIDFRNAFWDEVDRRHGEIRGAEAYEPDQTTFREPVQRLVGRYYRGARYDYREALDALRRQKLSPLRLRSELDKLDKTLPPIVDFDAIIIPDSGKQIGLIAPALAFEDIVLTHDPKTLEKVRKASKLEQVHPVTLLGGSTWNSPQTLDNCEAYCEDAVFVDGYFANNPDAKVRDFVAGFREANNNAEPTPFEAQAYDTMGLLKHVLATGHPPNRKALRDALEQSGPYNGVTGKMTFDAQGEAQRDYFVLTIKEHTIRLYERPPEPPRG